MKNIILTIIAIFFLVSCKKEWLDAKPDKSIVVPTTIEELQGLLDNNGVFNRLTYPSLGEIGADDYSISYTIWQGASPIWKNSYIWKPDIFEGTSGAFITDWQGSYRRIFYANVALEGVEKIIPDQNQINDWNNIKGSALFHRGFDFYLLSQEFAKPYDASTANSDLGIIKAFIKFEREISSFNSSRNV